MDWSDGTRYVGEWRNGLMNGMGVLEMWTRERYEGKFIGGRRNGKGRCDFPNGQVYIGRWKNGKPHGNGQFIDPADGGSKFFGTWVKGVRHGQGLVLTGSFMSIDSTSRRLLEANVEGEAVSVVYSNGEPQHQTVVARESILEMLQQFQDMDEGSDLGAQAQFNSDEISSPRTPRRPDFFRNLGIREKCSKRK